jgi:hypothetical protein
MWKRINPVCSLCEDDIYTEYLFHMEDYGLSILCERCFINYVKHNQLLDEYTIDDIGSDARELADELGIEYESVESWVENDYACCMDSYYETIKDSRDFPL